MNVLYFFFHPVSNVTPFYKRLLEIFETENTAEIARFLGLERQTLYRWRDGRNIPSFENLSQITKCTNVSLHWLLIGEGEKYVTRNVTNVPKKLAPAKSTVDTAPAPEPNPDTGIPTAQHRLQSIPLRGTIQNQRIVQEDLRVLVPLSLVDEASVLFKIDGNDLAAEGLHHGDLLIARPAENGDGEGKIVIALLSGKIIIRHYSTTKKLALLSPIEGQQPVIKAPINNVEVQYVVTSITRSFQ